MMKFTRRDPAGPLKISDGAGSTLEATVDGHLIEVGTAAGGRLLDGHVPLTFRGRFAVVVGTGVVPAHAPNPPTVRYVFGGEEAPEDEVCARAVDKAAMMVAAAVDARMLAPDRVVVGADAQVIEHARRALEAATAERARCAGQLSAAQEAFDRALDAEARCEAQLAQLVTPDPVERFDVFWPSRRATVAHLYVRGPGTGDAALCGAVLGADHRPQEHEGDPMCARCVAQAATWRDAPDGEQLATVS